MSKRLQKTPVSIRVRKPSISKHDAAPAHREIKISSVMRFRDLYPIKNAICKPRRPQAELTLHLQALTLELVGSPIISGEILFVLKIYSKKAARAAK